MRPSLRRRTWLRFGLLIGLSLLLSGCVKFHITINVEDDGSGTVGAAFGITSQAKALMESQGIDDPGDEIRGYLMREADASDVQEERWIDGDYEWVEYSTPFETLDELNSRVAQTEAFESFQVTEQSGLVNKTFVMDGIITPKFLETQVPDDIEMDITQVFDVRVAVTLPGEVTETNGMRGPRESNTVWWRIKAGAPIPIHAVSQMRDTKNVRLLAVGGTLLIVLAVVAVVLVGFGVYRLRQRKARQ